MRTLKHVSLFQSELFRDFQTSILERKDHHFSEAVVEWLDLMTGSHGQRAQILFQTLPQKLESASDDSVQNVVLGPPNMLSYVTVFDCLAFKS